MASDILFSAATVVTGDELAAPFEADVLVSGSLIAKIGPPGSMDAEAARKIDAKGHYLCPGFIDMHAHSDLYLLTNPAHEAKISQGCTVSSAILFLIQYCLFRAMWACLPDNNE